MNFTPLSLFNFQPLGNGGHKRGRLELAIREHRIDFSKSSYEGIGMPENIQIGTDSHYLAVWADPEGFPANLTRGNSGASINGSANVKRLQSRLDKLAEVDFRTHYVILSEPAAEDGKLIYDVDNMVVCAKQTRRSA